MSKALGVLQAFKEADGIDFAYDHFAEGETPQPPFCVYLNPAAHNFSADGAVYYPVNVVNIELYTEKKDPESEKKIEILLNEAGIFYEKTEEWIASEHLYEILYRFEEEYEGCQRTK